MDDFRSEKDEETKFSKTRLGVLSNKLAFDPEKYEYKEDWVAADISNPLDIHSTSELVECLSRGEKNPNIELEARVIATDGRTYGHKKLNKKEFLEAAKGSGKFKEANGYSWDGFGYDAADYWGGSNLVGHDFVPLLGGPFDKQLYYRDYLRMIATCFYAANHDPVAKAVIDITIGFTLGRGFTLQTNNEKAQVIWDAFRIANKFDKQMEYIARELCIYGETMLYWLPNHDARISFNPLPGEKVPKALIPRVRVTDPSNFAEIVTIPEDIVNGVLYYVWLAPTQYQTWTDGTQPTTKFIYNQIPAHMINHYKVNTVSNEKRGRSDFFSSLGYMKRLRDSINYSIIAEQKAAAWSIDTTIEGDDNDINDYMQQQVALGQYAPAGSEFVHSKAVTREYLSNQATGKGKESPVFTWCLNMTAMGTQIPVAYLGTHLAGGSSRASALVATEPVAKKFEMRRLVYEQIIRDAFDRVTQSFGVYADCEIIFPELVTQDRSAKLKDLQLAQSAGWITRERAATIAARELDIKNYSYDDEKENLQDEEVELGFSPGAESPLTTPAQVDQTKGVSAITAPEKQQIKKDLRQL